jgi:hypothetical protein
MATQTSDNYIIQILFGRYRSWDTISWTHLIVLGSLLFAMTYIYLLLVRQRLLRYDVEVRALQTRSPLTARPTTTTVASYNT